MTFPGHGADKHLGPQLVVDDGGDVTLLIHKGYELEKGSKWVDEPASSHEEQIIKNLLKRVAKERPGFWTVVVRDWKGVSEETTTGVHRLYQDEVEAGQAAGAGDQRQRLGHQVKIRQPLRLPRVSGRRSSSARPM